MKHLTLFILVFSLLFGCKTKTENNAEVTFKVLVKRQLQKGETAYLAGNHEKLGEWAPDGIALSPKDVYLEQTIKFPVGTDLKFKITKGSWDSEAVLSDGTVPQDYSVYVSGDTTLELVVHNWKDVIHKVEGQITGEVRFHRNMTWKNLKPRDILVWLPPGYDEEEDRRYPVLYAHDGQNLIDPATSYKGIDWQIDEVADTLIRSGQTEPFIIVGINNTPDRSEEYSKTDLGETYMEFIVRKLKPMIDEIYRTEPGQEHTATLGSSMGGLIAFMLGWEKNEVFGKSACFSPAFQYEEFDYVAYLDKSNGSKRSLELYIDNGSEGIEKILQPGCENMMKKLDNLGYPYEWYLAKGAEHDEAAWAKRVWRPLVQFYGNQE